MARSINEIYSELVAAKEAERNLDVLNSTSATAIWRLMLYVVAVAAYTLENLMDTYSKEVDERIDAIIPHRPKWYRDKVLNFMHGLVLPEDSDVYDTSSLTDEEIEQMKVVKHAVAVESDSTSVLTIKVATEEDGELCPLDSEVATELQAYIKHIKDAGVRINLVNKSADLFRCEADIYYNPMLSPDDVKAACRETIKQYLKNIPFNGKMTNNALVDNLQGVNGVQLAELKSSYMAEAESSTYSLVNAYAIPSAGYLTTTDADIVLNMIAYE